MTTTVRDIAQTLNAAGYGSEAEMTTLVTTLAAQCGYAAPEGGQSPDLVITAEDESIIRDAAVILVRTQREIDRDIAS